MLGLVFKCHPWLSGALHPPPRPQTDRDNNTGKDRYLDKTGDAGIALFSELAINAVVCKLISN